MGWIHPIEFLHRRRSCVTSTIVACTLSAPAASIFEILVWTIKVRAMSKLDIRMLSVSVAASVLAEAAVWGDVCSRHFHDFGFECVRFMF